MDLDGYWLTEAQVSAARAQVDAEQYVSSWFLEGPDAHQLAVEYTLKASWWSFFAVGWHVAYHHPRYEQPGILGLYSNGTSTQAQKETQGRVPGDVTPNWEHFDVWYWPGLHLGDLHGMIMQQGEYLGRFHELLDAVCINWRLLARQQYGQPYYQTLREVLLDIGAEIWVEVFAGYSYVQYRCLDVYWKIRAPSITDRMATWYLVNASRPPHERQLLRPDEWDQQLDYLCIDKRSQEFFDSTIEPVAGIEAFRHVAFQPLPQELLQSIALGAVRRLVPGMTLPFPTALDRQAYWNYLVHLKGKGKGKGKGKAQQQGMLMGPRL